MQVKTYTAPTKLEALLKVRDELGPEAVILHERQASKGWFLFKKPVIELVVATSQAEETGGDVIPTVRAEKLANARASSVLTADPNGVNPRGVEPKGVETYDPVPSKLRKLEAEMQELRTMVSAVHQRLQESPPEILNEPPCPTEHPLFTQLIHQGVELELAKSLISAVPRIAHGAEAKLSLKRALARLLPVGGVLPTERSPKQVVALVGPTGVGKTTTIAKLAATYALEHNRKVGLLSLDTYRIGAIEQLRTYAQIMDIPLQIAYDADEMREGLDALQGYDLVLIDTIGRSQRDEPSLQSLKLALDAAKATVYLAVAANTDTQTLYDVQERFAILDARYLIVTKLDETARFGPITNLIARKRMPVAYCADGQRVPEDLREADSEWLARQLI